MKFGILVVNSVKTGSINFHYNRRILKVVRNLREMVLRKAARFPVFQHSSTVSNGATHRSGMLLVLDRFSNIVSHIQL